MDRCLPNDRTECEGTSNCERAAAGKEEAAEEGNGRRRGSRTRRRRAAGEQEGTAEWTECQRQSQCPRQCQCAQLRCPPHRSPVPPSPCPSVRPFFPFCSSVLWTLPLLLFLTISSQLCTATARKSNEIEVDWGLLSSQLIRTDLSSLLTKSAQLGRQFVPTKYLRMKDVLRFHCPPPSVPLAVHLVPAESALLCQLPAEQRERERALIGYCGPNTSDPRLTIRPYSPLPGKPTFREGLSYFFISTSDGTADGVQAISGGLCRSNALRLRVVVLPTPSDEAFASSRPADEITDLAELLFPHSIFPSVRPPSPPSPVAASLSGFPAFLTVKDRAGQSHQVVVHSPAELAAQIDSASQRSGGAAGLELSVHQQQQRRRGGGVDGPVGDGQMPRYELTMGSSGGDDGHRHTPMKQVRSPEPLAESQKLVYIIGYGEGGAGGHEATSGGDAPAAPPTLFSVIIPTAMMITLLL